MLVFGVSACGLHCFPLAYQPGLWKGLYCKMRVLLLALAALALSAGTADASTQRLSKNRAHQKTETVLGRDQVAYMFDVQLIRDWAVEPADTCGRLSRRRVRCAFAVTLSDGTECGSWMTVLRWGAKGDQPAYLGWILGIDVLSDTFPGNCSATAARQTDAGRPRREIGDQTWGLTPAPTTATP